MNDVIYLDNAATTAVDPRVVEAMLECLGPSADYANPSSVGHLPGRRARARVEQARADVAALVGADPAQVIFTSGATEADNLAILGAARFYRERGRHVVTSRTEHPAVLDACRQLEREGFEVTYLKPGPDGIVEPAQVEAALRSDTLLVSLMHVNNEIGVAQDVGAVGRLCRERGVLFHVDAAQGVGALCVRREPRLGLVPMLHGGGQERGLRSGTLAAHQVVGLGTALRIAAAEMQADAARIAALRERLWRGLSALPGVLLNGHPSRRVPGILSVTFDSVEGESLLYALPGFAVSSGSACATTSGEPSYVLRALGRSDRLAQSTLRLSLGRFNTEADVDRAIEAINGAVKRLRSVAAGRGE